jgi:hypothetical protein
MGNQLSRIDSKALIIGTSVVGTVTLGSSLYLLYSQRNPVVVEDDDDKVDLKPSVWESRALGMIFGKFYFYIWNRIEYRMGYEVVVSECNRKEIIGKTTLRKEFIQNTIL